MIRVTIWNENWHERHDEHIRAVYPDGIHGQLAAVLGSEADFAIHTATLDEPEHGLTEAVLAETDVLIWWAHVKHAEVSDKVARRVQEHVLRGMGLIVLHSGHMSKPFLRLMGTSGTLSWRDGDRERVWTVLPTHPIAQGLPPYFELEVEEMYGEPFDIPQPDELVFISWFSGGEVFRSGCCWQRGYGRVFYFAPGHEEFPTYYNEHVGTVIRNAVRWAQPVLRRGDFACPNVTESPESRCSGRS
ncbi:MAG: ThuA domain-containing protein [Bacillota bacterium]|nr:ThuA domain-containing protein [Bacillota bacterium]